MPTIKASIMLYDANRNPIANAPVYIIFDDKIMGPYTTDNNGVAVATLDAGPGYYTIIGLYYGDYTHEPSYAVGTINISGDNESADINILYELSSESTTIVGLEYTRKDPRVSKLSLLLMDTNGNVIDTKEIDVSKQSGKALYNVVFNNRLYVLVVEAVRDTVTVNPESSLDYQVPHGYWAIIPAGDHGLSVKGYPPSNNVIAKGGTTVTIVNNGGNTVSLPILLVPLFTIRTRAFILEVDEVTEQGNVLYRHVLSIDDVQPIKIGFSS